ncbi:MAG: outer membrane beta-barrel protein [Candidatus Methylumidiphilus sp.]
MADLSDIFKPYVAETVTYDSNLFRFNSSVGHTYLKINKNPSTGQVETQELIKNDVMNQATVGSTVNYDLGRQKLVLDLTVSYNSFLNNSILNNVSSNDRVAWQWQLGRQFSGDVGYAYTRAMGGFTNTTFYNLDMINDNNVFTNLNYAWHPRWRVRTGFDFLDSQHSASARKDLDRRIYTGSIGVDYTTPSFNSTGLRYAYSDGNFPNRQIATTSTIPSTSGLVNNNYQQHNASTLLKWKITEKTSFSGDVGYTNREYPNNTPRNFSGLTYNLMLSWAPTSKTLLSVSGWRALSSWSDVTATYVLTDGFSISPTWQISPKLAVTGNFSHQTLQYDAGQGQAIGNFTLCNNTNNCSQRLDTVLSGTVKVAYTPASNVELSLGYLGATRSTNYTLPNNDLNKGVQNYCFSNVFASAMVKF